jgi:hypothetical protein
VNSLDRDAASLSGLACFDFQSQRHDAHLLQLLSGGKAAAHIPRLDKLNYRVADGLIIETAR